MRAEEDDDDDDEVEVIRVVKPPIKQTSRPPQRLNDVYLVLTCDYPLDNDKWGEHSGHETQDTKILGVFANLKDANREARLEAFFDDETEDSDTELFSWQEERPLEWTARRVWVEKKNVQY